MKLTALRAVSVADEPLPRVRLRTERIVVGGERTLGSAAPGARAALRVWIDSDDGNRGEGVAAPLGADAVVELAAAERALTVAAAMLDAVSPPRSAPPAKGPPVPSEAASPAVAAVRALLAPVAAMLAGSASARFAVETAALRLLSARAGLGVAEALRGAAIMRPVAVNALVSAGDAGAVEVAVGLAAAGYPAIKVKVGRGPWPDELRVVRALRAALPATCELRLDANGAWSLAEARARLEALADLAIALVEQPVAPAQLADLGPCATPWGADESLLVAGMAEALLDEPACAAFVLKPARLGLLDALALAGRGAARGKGVVITHLFDGPSALEAACDLALALQAPPLACGLMPWDDATCAVPHLRRAGLCTAPGVDAQVERAGEAPRG